MSGGTPDARIMVRFPRSHSTGLMDQAIADGVPEANLTVMFQVKCHTHDLVSLILME